MFHFNTLNGTKYMESHHVMPAKVIVLCTHVGYLIWWNVDSVHKYVRVQANGLNNIKNFSQLLVK